VQPPLPGLLGPATFQMTGGRGQVEVGLDTAQTAPGEHKTTLVLRPEGATTAVSIPVRFRVEPLKVRVQPERLDLGSIRKGASASSAVTLTAEPPGSRLVVRTALRPAVPGMKVPPTVQGNPAQLSVTVDTSALEPGKAYETEVVLEGNAGRVAVPVRFHVGTDWGVMVRPALLGTAGTAGALALCRAALATVTEGRWITTPEWDFRLVLLATPVALLALRWLGPLIEARRTPIKETQRTPEAGCIRLVGRGFTVLGALLIAPLLAPGWVAGLDLAAHGWRALGLDPIAGWAVNGAILGLLHGLGLGLLQAGQRPLGQALRWIGALLLLALLPLGWWGAPWITSLFRM
jgi:hypothetical protein